MALSFRLLSGPKVKTAIEDYIECVEKDEYDGISGSGTQRRRHWSNLQKKRRALFEKIPKHDLLVVAQDQALHARWIEAHVKYEKTALRAIVEDLDLGTEAHDALKNLNEQLSKKFGLLDSGTAAPVQDEDVERAVSAINKLMTSMPVVAAEVLKNVVPDVRDSIVRQCDQLRDAIQGIREHVRAEAIKNCQERLFLPHNLAMLVEHIRRQDAPQAALKESEELADLKEELSTANEELGKYVSLVAELESAKVEEQESRATAESELESVKSSEQQAQRDLAVARQEIQQLKDQLFDQRQAIDAFLEYSTASLAQDSASLVVAPSAEELTILHDNRTEEVTPNQAGQLPMIVIASGHLPAAFSYLCLASGGVLMGSRFNRAVTSSNVLWVSDTLDRVIKAVVASQEPVPKIVLIVLLQGIAYVHLATRGTTVKTATGPKDMLNSLYKLIPRIPQRTVLATVYRLVGRLVHHQSPITSWILDDSPLDKRIDSSNSALPEGITLIHSAGDLFLQESATDGERLFVIEPEAVQFVTPKVGHTDMILPPVNGFNLRHLEIARRLEHASTSSWLRENGLMARLM